MISRIDCVDDMASLVAAVSEGASVIAGGTDFTAMYGSGLLSAESAVDLNRVPDLTILEIEHSVVRIGAAVRLGALAQLAQPSRAAVVDGARLIGSIQTRNRATIGGNICRASPSGDTLPGLLVCGAVMIARSANGARSIQAEDFFVGPGCTALAPSEVLERVDLPQRSTVSAYHRSTGRKAMDLATVGVAVAIDVDGNHITGGRVAVGGAADRPLLVPGVAQLVMGRTPKELEVLAEDLDRQVQDVISPIDDARGSAWYRRRLIRPLIEKGLARVADRAAG